MYAADMAVNSSSASNYHSLDSCTSDKVYLSMATSQAALRTILLLPLSTFILFLGHQRWRQHRSSKAATHSDIFTYHVAAMELIWILGSFFFYGGLYTNHMVMMNVGVFSYFSTLSGEAFFHMLTCMERYLAVVHPITYMGLRNARGVRIRNICIGCVWLLSFGLCGVLSQTSSHDSVLFSLCFLVFSMIIISFCSLSVLCVLIRPGPGEGARDKQRVDQSKQRAFYTVTVISVTVWLWFVGLLVQNAMNTSLLLSQPVRCLVMINVSWLNLPSSLVSPLLYLHRAGKLSWCHWNNE